ncbi:MAG: nitroreductase [Asgard group archaeon]|nr:nitroreductase [Asgard group archaeon]
MTIFLISFVFPINLSEIELKYEKSIIATISKRVSRRAYDSKEIESSKLKKIRKILKNGFKGPFGGKSRFTLIDCVSTDTSEKQRLGTYGFIRGARYYILGILDNDEQNIVDFGYSFEKIILKMTELELGTVWLGATFRYNQFKKCTKIKTSEYIAAVTPVGYSLEKPKVYEKIISWGIGARKRKPWSKLFFLENLTDSLSENEASKYATVLEMVRLAPSARNEEPWRIVKEKDSNIYHIYLKLNRRFSDDSLPSMKQMDIGIAMSHFELTAKDQKLDGKWVKKNPNIDTNSKNLHYIASWIGK